MEAEQLFSGTYSSFAPDLDFRDDGSFKPEPYKRTPVAGYPTEIPGTRTSDWATGWMSEVVHKQGDSVKARRLSKYPDQLPGSMVSGLLAGWMNKGCGCGKGDSCDCSQGKECCDGCAQGGACSEPHVDIRQPNFGLPPIQDLLHDTEDEVESIFRDAGLLGPAGIRLAPVNSEAIRNARRLLQVPDHLVPRDFDQLVDTALAELRRHPVVEVDTVASFAVTCAYVMRNILDTGKLDHAPVGDGLTAIQVETLFPRDGSRNHTAAEASGDWLNITAKQWKHKWDDAEEGCMWILAACTTTTCPTLVWQIGPVGMKGILCVESFNMRNYVRGHPKLKVHRCRCEKGGLGRIRPVRWYEWLILLILILILIALIPPPLKLKFLRLIKKGLD